MKPEEIKKYDQALSMYSMIIRGKYSSPSEISECIEILEYFEDYEKCKDLNRIKEINKNKITN